MKSSPQNSHFCRCQIQNVTGTISCCLSNFQCKQLIIQTKQQKQLSKILTKILIDWGGPFLDINFKNNGAIVILQLSTLFG